MSKKIFIAFFVIFIFLSLEVSTSSAQTVDQDKIVQEIYESMMAEYDPFLIRQAEEKGIYDRDEYPVWRGKNPFFIRGDFNGDGGMDIAFWISQKDTGFRGIAIIHSTLDTMYVFGAGIPGNYGSRNVPEMGGDTWHLLPAGTIVEFTFSNVPEIGYEKGKPFTFERETLEFVALARSSYVLYWANGKYWVIWTGD